MTETNTAEIIESPLAGLHRRSGAKLGVWFGSTLPDDWGDAVAEERYANESVALIDKNYRAYVSFTGPDRVRYLNAILTNNIKDLATNQGIVSLALNPQGHILAEIETYALADKLFCVSHAMIRERLVEWLDKYIIMDDVTLTNETERYGTLALEGPQATKVVQELTGIALEQHDELHLIDSNIASIPCRIVKRSPGEIAGAELIVAREKLAELWLLLEATVRRNGGGPMGYTALSARRLLQGIPWFGYDFGEKQIPHEAGLENSHISYTKGCYTGQEIIERVRSRGQVNRKRVQLSFSSVETPTAGTTLTVDDKEAGYVTRAAKPASLPHSIGMGYVRKEFSDAGTPLRWAGGTATPIEG